MAAVSIDLEMKRVTNEAFVEKAKKLEGKLIENLVKPTGIVTVDDKGKIHPGAKPEDLPGMLLKKGDSVVLDFGDHQVGYVSLTLK